MKSYCLFIDLSAAEASSVFDNIESQCNNPSSIFEDSPGVVRSLTSLTSEEIAAEVDAFFGANGDDIEDQILNKTSKTQNKLNTSY